MRLHLALVSLFTLSAISGTAPAQGAPSDPPIAEDEVADAAE